MHSSREREEDRLTDTRPPEPAAPQPAGAGALDWASAIGNQAVARIARQALDHDETEAAESEADETAPPEVEQLESQGIGMDALAGLAAVDDMAEGDLPE
jgi:hypothetical protein